MKIVKHPKSKMTQQEVLKLAEKHEFRNIVVLGIDENNAVHMIENFATWELLHFTFLQMADRVMSIVRGRE